MASTDQTDAIPQLPEEVRALQERVAVLSSRVESGEERLSALLGLIPRRPKKLTGQDRLDSLQDLLSCCRRLHTLLSDHRTFLVSYFSKLALMFRLLVGEKVSQVRELERKRTNLAKVAGTSGDKSLASRTDELKARLERFVRILGQAAILFLRHMERCREALVVLEEDQNRRREWLERLEGRVDAYTQMRALEMELSTVEQRTGVEPSFGSGLHHNLLPFEDLLSEVGSVDQQLRRTGDEITDLVKRLQAARPGDFPFASMEERAVDHLLHARGDPVALWNVVRGASSLDEAAAEVEIAVALGNEPGLDPALNNIQDLVYSRLEDCFGEDLRQARRLDTPGAWNSYLDRYPRGAGSEEARQALKRLEAEKLASARAAADILKSVPLWKNFVSDFPNSESLHEARETLTRLRADVLNRARSATAPRQALDAWHAFSVLFPEKTFEEAKESLEGYHGAQVRVEPTPHHWRDYLEACPQGPLAAEATEYVNAYAWVPGWAVAWGMDPLPNGRCWADLQIQGVTQRFRLIEPGVFLMGSPENENGEPNEQPVHEVTMTKPYWLAETECTQAFWKALTGTNPSRFEGEDHPVECVSWEDCFVFLKALYKMAPELDAWLPTEAQWEYACRAGTSGPFAGSGVWQEMGWVMENSGGTTHPVKKRSPNEWGFYDMHGNVAEWVCDAQREYGGAGVKDPTGSLPGVEACHRGGSWEWGASASRSARRSPLHRGVRAPNQGLRVLIPASSTESSWVYHATGGPVLDRLSNGPDRGVFLGELPPLRAIGAYFPTVKDAWGQRSCRIAGRTCATFVTVHPPGEFVWPIPESAFRFTVVLARADTPETFHASWNYEIRIDDRTVFQSPSLAERRSGIPVEIEIPPCASYLTVITDALGDNIYDHAILAWPYFHLRPEVDTLACIPDDAMFLGELTPIEQRVGHGKLQAFQDVHGPVANPDGGRGAPLPLGGKPCTVFLDIHAPASVTYEIPDEAHRFTAIGSRWDVDFASHGTWKYEVWIDGALVFDSAPMHRNPEGIPIDVSLPETARLLTIVVHDFGDNSCDWSILAYPYFHLAESASHVARRMGLQPGEAAFRTAGGGWLCAQGEDLVEAGNPMQPGVRFRWHWRHTTECLFALLAADGRFVRMQSDGRLRLMGPPDFEKEYHTLVHAADGRYAIRPFGPFWTIHDLDRAVFAGSVSIGSRESFEIIDVRYPPPPRPSVSNRKALAAEAVLHLDFDNVRASKSRGKQKAVRFPGSDGKRVIIHNARFELGRRGKALAFNGVDSAMELRPAATLKGSELTIAFWLYYQNYVRSHKRNYWLHQVDGNRQAMALYTDYGRICWNGGDSPAYSRGEVQFRQWHQVTVVVYGMRNILYIDGFPQIEGSGLLNPGASAPIWFGRAASGEPESFVCGSLEDIWIINRAMSPREVRALALP